MARPKLDIPDGVTCVSPSQMSVAMRCWRLWAFQYLLGLREPGGRGAAFGNRVHEVHEDYLEHGIAPDPLETWTFRGHLVAILDATPFAPAAAEARLLFNTSTAATLDKQMFPGKVALAMMPQGIYPAPRSGIVEKHFVYKRTKEIWYQGLVDWHVYDRATRRLKVIDHKTSADPVKYGLVTDAPHEDDPAPRKQLRTDHQGLIYARAGLEEYLDPKGGEQPEGVDLYWNYGKSDGVRKHSYVAEAHFDNVGEVYARFENDVHPWAVEMHRLKQMNAEPLSLDPSPNNCRAFNRLCSHASACNLTTEDKLGALLMSTAPNANPLLAKILPGVTNAAATPAPLPAPAAGDVVSPPEAHGPVPAVAAPTAAPTPAPLAPVPGQGAPVVSTVAGVLPVAAAPTPAPAPVAVAPTPAAAPAPAPIAAAAAVAPVVGPPAASDFVMPCAPADFWDKVATKVAAALVAKVSK